MRPGVVLVSPKYPGNVGAVMRLMANFGLRTLHIVDPRADLADPAVASMAVGAEARVRAKVFHTLPEALRPFHAVLASSSGRGRRRPPLQPFGALPGFIAEFPPQARIALLFGAEDRGLSQEEMALAHAVFRIPTRPGFPVMNLAQAAALVIHAAAGAGPGMGPAEDNPAATQDLEGLFGHLRTTLLDIGFLHEPNPDRVLADLRGMALRARLTPRDVLLLRGILRQVKNYPHILDARRRAAAKAPSRGRGGPVPSSTRESGSGR